MIATFAYIFSLLAFASGTIDTTPKHIHLSVFDKDNTQYAIKWATQNESNSIVYYGTITNDLNSMVEGTVTLFTEDNPNGLQWIHTVILKDLIPAMQYFYYVSSDSSISTVYNFTTISADLDYVHKFLVFGDMGDDDGPPSLNLLIEEAQSVEDPITAAIHIGDFAYDMQDNGGVRGDIFMEQIEPIASHIPYMTCPGNHEIIDGNFSHYRNRFSMPRSDINSFEMWYSWNVGLVHFVSYSTEVFFAQSESEIEAMLEWLENDLIEANNERDIRPWIIAFGHRPMYCSNYDNSCVGAGSSGETVQLALEDLFFNQGIDLIFEGHEHSYERSWPIYNNAVIQKNYQNPQAPVHIISGSAGCSEGYGFCLSILSHPKPDWAAFRYSGLKDYGFGHLIPYNSTHLYWDQIRIFDNKIIDSIWIIQTSHGPFSK